MPAQPYHHLRDLAFGYALLAHLGLHRHQRLLDELIALKDRSTEANNAVL